MARSPSASLRRAVASLLCAGVKLLATAENGYRTFIANSGAKYDLNKVLGVIMTVERQKQEIHHHHGDKITVHGGIHGSNNNIKSTLTEVSQAVGMLPVGDEAEKEALQLLIGQLNDALQQLPEGRAEDAEAVAQMAGDLVEKASQPTPNKTMLNITGKGLMEAANAVAEVAPKTLAAATDIVATIGKITGT